jgi:Protein of unknown function (DUF2911)
MRKMLICLVALFALPLAAQQLRLPRQSPTATLTQTVGITDITIKYSRPGVKGRQIWGGLVPFDQIWRTGANEATTIEFSDEVHIGGQKLPKGKYAFFTIPGRDEWTLVFNSQADQWGAFNHDKTKDALSIKSRPEKAEFREWMEFEIPEMTTDTAKILVRWENIAVPFTVDTKSTERSLAAAKTAVANVENTRWSVPLNAANFAFDAGRMDEAKAWLDQALAVRENLPTLWLKARMQQKAGQTAEAKKTAAAAIAKATEAQRDFANEIKRQSDAWK